MTERIKVAQYHGRPIVELEFDDSVVWKVRQPLEADYYRITEATEKHRERVKAYAEDLAKKASARAEAANADGKDGDAAGRELIEEQSDEDRLPLEVTERYQRATVLAIFVEPEQEPADILKRLGPDIVHELFQRVMDVLGGGAAKKRLAATSQVTT